MSPCAHSDRLNPCRRFVADEVVGLVEPLATHGGTDEARGRRDRLPPLGLAEANVRPHLGHDRRLVESGVS